MNTKLDPEINFAFFKLVIRIVEGLDEGKVKDRNHYSIDKFNIVVIPI